MTIPESEPSFNFGAQRHSLSNEVVSAENAPKMVSSSARRRPRYLDMVVEAVKNLKSRRGTSLQAIKKYLKVTYQVSVEMSRTTHLIHKIINVALEKDILVSVSGKGVSGSFKLGQSAKKSKASEKVTEAANVKKAPPVKQSKKMSSASSSQKVVTNKNENVQKVKRSKKTVTIVLPDSETSESAAKKPSAKNTKARRKKTNLQVRAEESSPRFEELVLEAVKNLKNRSGSSLQAIKKYLSDTHKVNVLSSSRLITEAINAAVQKGILVRISGRGACGSFKVGETAKESKDKAEAASSKADSNPIPK